MHVGGKEFAHANEQKIDFFFGSHLLAFIFHW